MTPDSPPTANVLIDCTGSSYGTGEVEIAGCTIQHSSKSPDSANIRIIGRSNPAKDQPVVREGHVTITGNVLSDVRVNVHLRDVRGVVITGNTFYMGYDHDLLVEESSNIVIGVASQLNRAWRCSSNGTNVPKTAWSMRISSASAQATLSGR